MDRPVAAAVRNAEARLAAAAAEARGAEDRGDGWEANRAWERYRLINDAMRDPDELLAEGIALSYVAIRLAAER
jgi:negative regulator of sigma E activity